MNNENKIELKSVKDLREMKFFVPNYQRGYKWKEPQVEDLLNDIKDSPDNESYCLQPLVVRERSENEYEVIDGQQRLTTIFLILKYLEVNDLYELSYETRKGSKEFLSDIKSKGEKDAKDNVDFHHMNAAYETIRKWFGKNKTIESVFAEKIKERVCFIWYEPEDDSSGEEIFKRLNIGKISLTNGELIKALFLNRNEFDENTRKERAKEWNKIENKFQDEKFWLWIYGRDYKSPTRIDFIFELIRDNEYKNESLELSKKTNGEYKIFRSFYEYFLKKEESIKTVWNEVIDIFNVFNVWYEDTELYNYVGYLLDSKIKSMEPKIDVPILLKKWRDLKDNESKNEVFKEECINLITKKLEKNGCQNLATQYELDSKRNCIPLLFLHNIQTSINEKKKFEFHLFRETEGKRSKWQVEHIDPETPNDLSGKDVKNWLLYQKEGVKDKALLEMIDKFINDEHRKELDFEQIIKKLESNLKGSGRLSEEQKNRIDNFALLDETTNIKNSNKLFSQKCDIVNGKTDYKPGFIPICTKEVFKDSDSNKNKPYWYESDAKNYRADMLKKLEKFGVYYKEEK